jgi:hypothetical protein
MRMIERIVAFASWETAGVFVSMARLHRQAGLQLDDDEAEKLRAVSASAASRSHA